MFPILSKCILTSYPASLLALEGEMNCLPKRWHGFLVLSQWQQYYIIDSFKDRYYAKQKELWSLVIQLIQSFQN